MLSDCYLLCVFCSLLSSDYCFIFLLFVVFVFLFRMFCFIFLCVLCFLLFCIVSLRVCSYLFYVCVQFTHHCHRVETQLQFISIISYQIISYHTLPWLEQPSHTAVLSTLAHCCTRNIVQSFTSFLLLILSAYIFFFKIHILVV
jgi:hypothetical protein